MAVESINNFMTLEEVMAVMGYTSRKNTYMAIHKGVFPIPLFKYHGRWVADSAVVKRYFELQRERGFAELEARASGTYVPPKSRASR